jgi:hypothetical protein
VPKLYVWPLFGKPGDGGLLRDATVEPLKTVPGLWIPLFLALAVMLVLKKLAL